MSVELGHRFGPYEIVGPLGAGGMGEVFRARDSRLNREVALKILPDAVASDPVRRARFAQEARAIAALNHPNILAIHDAGENYIVTELVDGESLRALIAEGPMASRNATAIAAQIADGLAAAHGAGIVHRDIKPENIMMTGDGRVKLLDFGLARLTTRSAAANETAALTKTAPGMVLGTAAYMAPEQVRAEEAGPATDIFSLGVVIHEMVSGRHPFAASSTADTMAAILRADPPDAPAAAPPALTAIIARCLEKQPARRFQSASDLAFALRNISATSGIVSILQEERPRRRRMLIGAAAALAGVCLATAAVVYALRPPAASAGWRFRRITFDAGLSAQVTATKDGKLIAYSSDRADGNFDIWVQQRAGGAAIRLTTNPATEHSPAFSPDGTKIAFVSIRSDRGIYVVPALGGDERLLARGGNSPSFSPDGAFVAYSTGQTMSRSEIWIVPSEEDAAARSRPASLGP
jgi:eukaryotic-like serine/threonine-protein kinase